MEDILNQPEEEKETIKIDPKIAVPKVADALLQKAHTFRNPVPIRPKNKLHAFFQKKGWMPMVVYREYTMYPITMAPLVEITGLLISIDMDIYDPDKLLESMYKLINYHGRTTAKIIAVAIHGKDLQYEPLPEKLEREVFSEFDNENIEKCLGLVIRQMNMVDFMKSIVSIKGLAVIETNPKTTGVK